MNCEFRWNFDEREKIVDIQLTVNLVMSNNIYCWTDVIMLRELIGRSLQNMKERQALEQLKSVELNCQSNFYTLWEASLLI